MLFDADRGGADGMALIGDALAAATLDAAEAIAGVQFTDEQAAAILQRLRTPNVTEGRFEAEYRRRLADAG